MKMSLISIVMGSDSDLPVMKEACDVLNNFGIGYEVIILSAHRTPDETADFAKKAMKRGVKVIIAGAGLAAHLAGVIASHFPLPVIGIPMKSGPLNGLDALYSTVQMPPGIPVATVGIGNAKNAALLAIQILAIENKKLFKEYVAYRKKQTDGVIKKNQKLQNIGIDNYLKYLKQ